MRYVAIQIYYANHAFASQPGNNNLFTANLTALEPYAEPYTIDGTCTQLPGWSHVARCT